MLRPAALRNNKPTSYRNVASCDVHTNTSRRSASPEAAEERSGASGYPGSPNGDYIYIYRVIDRAPQNVTLAHSSYRSRWAPLRRGIDLKQVGSSVSPFGFPSEVADDHAP